MKFPSSPLKLLLACLFPATLSPFFVSGQQQTGGVPLSFCRALGTGNVMTTEIPSPPAAMIRQNEESPSFPYCFAINLPVDLSPANSGNTEILQDGQRMWRLSVHSSGAKALILYFDRFRIPAGGKLFVYNPSRTKLYGAYTSANNNSFGTFTCPLIAGEALVLEYNDFSALALPDIHVSEVAYAFRGFTSYEENNPVPSAGNCEVNINCSEGNNWQKQKRGVVKLMIKDSTGLTWLCTGSMINNTNNDGTPYLLTANHCGRVSRPVDISHWLFYFNYEMPGCPNTIPATGTSLLGAVKKANGGSELTGSDFFLVKLSESIPDSVHVYFNGWDREDVASPNGTGIHHPEGDVKKISTYTSPLTTAYWSGNPNPCFWQVVWAQTVHGHGVTEGGSSGSPIFNSQGQIVGTLTGGDSSCDSSSLDSPDYYGKFSWHWDRNGTDSSSVLKYWLDPNNTGVLNMGGWSLGLKDQVAPAGISLYPNPVREKATISLDDEKLIEDVVTVSIVDILGNPVPSYMMSETSHGRYSLDLQSLSPGMYFVIISGNNFRKSIKLIKI